MFCPKCGVQNPDEAKFCSACGSPFQTAAPPLTTQAQPAPPAPITPPAYVPPPTTSGKAVASLICGFLFFFPPTAIAAVVLGHISLSDIRKSAGRIMGRGIAIGGLVLGYFGIAIIPIILIVAAIAIPNFVHSRMALNQASAVSSLRQISVAATSYAATYNNGYPPDLESLSGTTAISTCDHAGLIDGILAGGIRNGYIFTYTPTARDTSGNTNVAPTTRGEGCTTMGSGGFTVTADPVTRGTTGQSSYYTDSTGVIRVEQNGPATAQSDPLE